MVPTAMTMREDTKKPIKNMKTNRVGRPFRKGRLMIHRAIHSPRPQAVTPPASSMNISTCHTTELPKLREMASLTVQ